MSADVRQRLQEAAIRDEAGPDVDAILSRAGQLRRWRLAARGAVGLALAAALAAAVLPGAVWSRIQLTPDAGDGTPQGDVLAVPSAEEEVAPAFLSDGTPVFVVNLGERGVHVLDARSPSAPYGEIRTLVGWCRSSGWFEDYSLGSRFTADGYYADGPAPTGLARYAVERLDGGRVRTGEGLTAPPRSDTAPDAEPRGPSCFDPPGDVMSPDRDPIMAERWLEQVRGHYVDLAMDPDGGVAALAPSAALAEVRDGQVLVYATLEVAGRRAYLCDPDAGGGAGEQVVAGRCPPGSPSFELEWEAAEREVRGWRGLMLVEVRDGRVVGATLTAAVVEYFWSLVPRRPLLP